MPEQLLFTGIADLPAAPEPPDSLFFAIRPESIAATLDHLALGFRARHALAGRPLGANRFHVSLHCLGQYFGLPRSLVDRARAAAMSLVAPPFNVEFDRVLSFSRGARERPLVLCGGTGLIALKAFQRNLGQALANAGLGRFRTEGFTPHVTLLYDRQMVAEQRVEPVSWTVDEFVLVHSLVGKSQHRVLGRWPLRG